MKRALAEPALQLLGAVLALFVFTWPFLVLERPVHVFVYFFVCWAAIIAALFAFAHADERARPGEDTGTSEAPDA